jgi:hypothetical protein
MTQTPAQSFQVVAMRAARLAANGTPVTGTSQGYVSKAPLQVQLSMDFENGKEFTQENGAGNICAYYKGPDKFKKVDISFDLCDLDAELISILTSDDVDTIVTGAQTTGFIFPRVAGTGSGTILNGVSLEFWSKRWVGGGAPTSGLYWHWWFPKAILRIGDMTMENDFLKVPITGYLQENGNFGNGPGDDFSPAPLNAIGAVSFTDTLPTESSTYVNVPFA